MRLWQKVQNKRDRTHIKASWIDRIIEGRVGEGSPRLRYKGCRLE